MGFADNGGGFVRMVTMVVGFFDRFDSIWDLSFVINLSCLLRFMM